MSDELTSRSDDESTPPGPAPDAKNETVTIQLRIPYSAYRLYKKGNYQLCILPNRFLDQPQFSKAEGTLFVIDTIWK